VQWHTANPQGQFGLARKLQTPRLILFGIADKRETVDCGVEDPVLVVPVAAIDIE
jgi:hypothetical protein